MRTAFINTLIKQAKAHNNLFLLTADLGFNLFEPFQQAFPDRFINVGVAEQNMMGIAAGLALSGNIVFTYSIATFATMRPFEQIRTDIASHNCHVIIIGGGGGYSYGHDSLTHHAVEDIGIMRMIPGMTVLTPADPVEVTWAITYATLHPGPYYIRLGKRGEPVIHHDAVRFKLGKGTYIVKGSDIAILICGSIIKNTIDASHILAKKNIHPTIISMHTIKPIDKNLIITLSKKYKLIVTIEEHNIIGGLGSAVAEVLSEIKTSCKLKRIGIPDTLILDIGSQQYLQNITGLSANKIAKTISHEIKTI